MKPYYQDSAVTIYHGDCREVLPQLDAVDVVVTDPPYGIDGGRGGTSLARGKGNYDTGFEDTPEFIRTVVVPALFEIAQWKTLAVTPGSRCINLYPVADSFGVYFQPAGSGMQRFGMSDAHPILYYGWHHLQGLKPLPCSKLLVESPENNGHPCPKPEKAWMWLVNKVARPCDTVLDPFMGSGTTLRVAKDLGIRHAIGIDISERYCEIAAKRMGQEVFNFQ